MSGHKVNHSTWKQGDVFHWSYNDKELERRSHGNNGGTTYWCCSQIGIINERGVLEDTYWGNSSSNRFFTFEQSNEQLELTFKGNLNDYHKAQTYERACYSDKDCLDLSHANNRISDNFYVRKDAVHDLEKKRKIIQRSKKRLEQEIAYKVSQIERYGKMLEDKSYEQIMSIPHERGISLSDEDYLDYE